VTVASIAADTGPWRAICGRRSVVDRRTTSVTTTRPQGRTTAVCRPQIALVRGPCCVVRRTVSPVADRFRLYDGRTTEALGSYACRRAAWLAADYHLLRRLATRGDWVLGEYLVVSESVAGALDIESQITHLGPPDDLDGCRQWLRTLPGRG